MPEKVVRTSTLKLSQVYSRGKGVEFYEVGTEVLYNFSKKEHEKLGKPKKLKLTETFEPPGEKPEIDRTYTLKLGGIESGKDGSVEYGGKTYGYYTLTKKEFIALGKPKKIIFREIIEPLK